MNLFVRTSWPKAIDIYSHFDSLMPWHEFNWDKFHSTGKHTDIDSSTANSHAYSGDDRNSTLNAAQNYLWHFDHWQNIIIIIILLVQINFVFIFILLLYAHSIRLEVAENWNSLCFIRFLLFRRIIDGVFLREKCYVFWFNAS